MKDNLCYVIVYKVKRSEFEPRGRQCHSLKTCLIQVVLGQPERKLIASKEFERRAQLGR